MNKKMRMLYTLMVTGGAIGTITSFVQLIDKLELLKNSNVALACNINSIFSCSDVLNAWQSSVFGFPNTMISLAFFVFFGTIGLVGLSGGTLPRKLRIWTQGMALFMLAFALWFLLQSIYSINALCLLCMVLFSCLLLINGALLRINSSDLPLRKSLRKRVEGWIKKDTDILVWVSLAVVLGLLMVQRFI